MAFDFEQWKEQTRRSLLQWKKHFQRAGTRSVYYFLAGTALLPVAQAVHQGDWGALAVLGAALGGSVGTNLLANLIQQAKDRSEDEMARLLEQEAARSPELQKALDALLEKLEALPLAESGLDEADRTWFAETLKAELAQIKSGITYTATLTGTGAIAQGAGATALGEGSTLVHGDYIAPGGTKITAPDPRELARQETEKNRRAYLEKLRRHCQALPLAALGGEEGTDEEISLDDVYIDLNTTRRIRKEDLEALQNGKQDTLPDELPEGELERKTAFAQDDKTTFLPAFEAVRLTPRLVLLGDPGAGKSTFVRKLLGWQAAALLGECAPPPGFASDLLPVLIVLRELAIPLGELSLAGLSAEAQKRRLLEAVHRHLNNPLVSEALEAGKVLLALDGLDEVPQDLRQTVRRAVMALVTEYRLPRLILTSRIRSYTGQAVFKDLPVFTLRSFDEEQIERFVRAWYLFQTRIGRMREQERDERIRDLSRAATSPDLRDIASNPMMLTSMAIIHQKEIGLPKERVRLYKLVVDVLLRRWQKYKLGEGQMAPSEALLAFLKDENRLLGAMERLAYEAQRAAKGQKETADVPRLRTLEILEAKEYLGSIGLAQEFLDYVDQRAGLLRGNGGELEKPTSYSFPHRTFQEYLAGCYLIGDRSAVRQYRQHLAEGDTWMLAALLGAEELYYNRRSAHVLRDLAYELLRDPTPRSSLEQRAALWSGLIACIAGREEIEADKDGVREGAEYLEQIRKALLHVLEGSLPPLERAEAGRALARLGDPRPEVLACEHMAFCHVPAGEFIFGEGKEQKKIRLPEYWIGKYPVTNAQFQQFVQAGGYDNPDFWAEEARQAGYWTEAGFEGRWDNAPRKAPVDYGEPFNLPNHPVVGISWYEALAFTRWLSSQLPVISHQWSVNGGEEEFKAHLQAGQLHVTLPTEEQWEKAARGVDGRAFPWEGDFDPNKANTEETGLGTTTAVGAFPLGASPYGCLDMSGNVWEWVNGEQNLRGGSYILNADWARCAFRYGLLPDNWLRDYGFRVVVSPFFSL